MFLKNLFPTPAGALLGLMCGYALALPCGALRADEAKGAAPTFLSIPSPAAQLRPIASDEAAPPAAKPAPPAPAGPILAFDANTDGGLPPGPGEVAASTPGVPPAGSETAPSTAVETGNTPSASVDSTPQPSVPPGPAQDPGLAKSPLISSDSGDGTTRPDPAPAAAGSSDAWKNSYVNLVNLLVSRGILTKQDSSSLITQAEHDAAAANVAQASAPAPQAPATATATPNPEDDTMRVGYVPEAVKQQMRDEIKADVMKQAEDEHWASPNTTPDWVQRYHVAADIRLRYEGQYFGNGNDKVNGFVNFNAINTGSPFDITKGVNPQSLDVDQDRNRFRLRARIGADIDVGSGFTAGMRVATGSDDNPVTENQTFGASNNGQGGDFSKYSIWLDRAFLKYQLGGTPDKDFSVTIGRMDNPFFASSMIWADDLGFDGLVAKGKYKVLDGVTPFLTGGAFPVYNTDFNFAANNPAKFQSEDKWLYAVQGGTDWQISKDFSFKGAVAYYDFEDIQGKVSSPLDSATATAGTTDDSRPSFAQNGNTYIALRNYTTTGGVAPATSFPQYFGLATPFHELAITSQLDYSGLEPYHVILMGEVVKNLAFDRNAIDSNGAPTYLGGPGPQNNLSGSGSFDGGDTGYNIRLTMGHPTLTKLWDWNVNLTYRYIESDAVVDGFTDADFGGNLTGTNLKGYIIGGNLALTSRVWTSLRWMSAQSIAGQPYENDLIQVDVNAKF